MNEGKYDKELDKIEAAVQKASSFMNIGKELKKAGIKYDFSTSMIPLYMIKVSGNTIAIANKSNVAGAEREVGDTAIGLLEGFTNENSCGCGSSSNESINEFQRDRQLRNPEKEMMVVKGGKVQVIDKKDWKKYKSKGYLVAEELDENKKVKVYYQIQNLYI